MNPARKPNDRQKQNLREELHDALDRIFDAWPDIEHQAREMGRGYPSGGQTMGSGTSSPTERIALADTPDPSLKAEEWCTLLLEMVAHVRTVDRRRISCLPSPVTPGRLNSVEKCSECNLPLVGKVKRLDNDPLHFESPGSDEHGVALPVCFWQRQRRARGVAKGA